MKALLGYLQSRCSKQHPWRCRLLAPRRRPPLNHLAPEGHSSRRPPRLCRLSQSDKATMVVRAILILPTGKPPQRIPTARPTSTALQNTARVAGPAPRVGVPTIPNAVSVSQVGTEPTKPTRPESSRVAAKMNIRRLALSGLLATANGAKRRRKTCTASNLPPQSETERR